jgi:hypothetical protein
VPYNELRSESVELPNEKLVVDRFFAVVSDGSDARYGHARGRGVFWLADAGAEGWLYAAARQTLWAGSEAISTKTPKGPSRRHELRADDERPADDRDPRPRLEVGAQEPRRHAASDHYCRNH